MAESAKLFIYLNDMCICAPISIYHCLSINNIYICNKSIHWCDLLIFLNHPKQSARRSNNFHQAAHTERYYLPPPQPPHIFVEELKARSFWRSRKPQTYSTNYMPIYHFFFKYISATYARVETQCMLRMLWILWSSIPYQENLQCNIKSLLIEKVHTSKWIYNSTFHHGTYIIYPINMFIPRYSVPVCFTQCIPQL
jgi:hypothetical protein